MEVTLRYTLLTLFTLLILFTLFKTVNTKLLFTSQTVACMPIYIVEVRALLDLGFVRASEQKFGLD